LDELIERVDQKQRAEMVASLAGSDDDDSPGPEEIRQVVREEMDREVATDGGGQTAVSDPLTAAIREGASPEELEKVAEVTGGSPWAEVGHRALSLVESSDGVARAVGEVVSSVLASRQGGQTAAQTRPASRADAGRPTHPQTAAQQQEMDTNTGQDGDLRPGEKRLRAVKDDADEKKPSEKRLEEVKKDDSDEKEEVDDET